jgi:hypothetical protein
MVDAMPTLEESTLAVVKAVAARRAGHRDDIERVALTTAAIAERVTGITLPPRRGRDGWWLVGRVLDELDDAELSVWYMPGTRRIGVSRRRRPVLTASAPAGASPYYYDGLRRKWIDARTGETVVDPAPLGSGRQESGSRAAT